MLCLCLQQSGLWILDVALPVGSALKDDGKVGEYVIIDSPVRWIAASVLKHHPRNDASRWNAPLKQISNGWDKMPCLK
jgi:hypothetical protein